MDRRHFLLGSASAVLASGTLTWPALAQDAAARSPAFFGLVSVEAGRTTDQAAKIQDMMESGYLADGTGQTFNVSGDVTPAGNFRGLRNINIKQLNPDAANRKTLFINGLSGFSLDNVEIDGGGVFSQSGGTYLSINGGLWVQGCSKFRIRDINYRNGGPGTGIVLHSSSDFFVSGLSARDMRYELAVAPNDILQGILFYDCHRFGALQCQAVDFTATVGGVATKRYTRGIVMGKCSEFAYNQMFARNVDQGIDFSGSDDVDNFTATGCVTDTTETWGIKFSNHTKKGAITGCVSKNAGLAGFVLGVTTSPGSPLTKITQDLKFSNCIAYNPGGSAASGSNNWCGFLVGAQPAIYPGYPQGISFDSCRAIDDRGGGAFMKYGFFNEVDHLGTTDFRRNTLSDNCVSTGHTIARQGGFHYARAAMTGKGRQTIESDQWTGLDLNVEEEDTCKLHDASKAADRIAPLEDGVYEISFRVEFAPADGGERGIRLQYAGPDDGPLPASSKMTPPSGAAAATVVETSFTGKLLKDAPFILQVYQNSGRRIAISRENCRFTINKIGGV